MPLNDIPLRMYGLQVGTADISDEGDVTLHVTTPCQFAIDWITEFAAGQHDSLNLVTSMSGQPTIPPPPAPAE